MSYMWDITSHNLYNLTNKGTRGVYIYMCTFVPRNNSLYGLACQMAISYLKPGYHQIPACYHSKENLLSHDE